ncbi:MAG TPA: hypothetical protein VNA69_22825 [Thermoanaerobaculia bacterium]|nr:hypothetical protein [Thermoanaerobaculia bacterium]
MNPSRFSLRSRIAALVVFAAVAIAPSAILLDRLFGRDVLLISPHDEATVELNRSLHADGDPVAEIYGNPLSKPVRVVLLTERNVIHPAEDSSLALLPAGGDAPRPLQVQTVYFIARYAILALLLLSLVIAFLPIPRALSCSAGRA